MNIQEFINTFSEDVTAANKAYNKKYPTHNQFDLMNTATIYTKYGVLRVHRKSTELETLEKSGIEIDKIVVLADKFLTYKTITGTKISNAIKDFKKKNNKI